MDDDEMAGLVQAAIEKYRKTTVNTDMDQDACGAADVGCVALIRGNTVLAKNATSYAATRDERWKPFANAVEQIVAQSELAAREAAVNRAIERYLNRKFESV